MNSPIKPNSFAEIFTKPDNEIDENIAKGYLCRREVTEILDHVNKKDLVVCESDGNGGLTWKVGDTVIIPDQKTNTIPFWMRRISHSWNLTFSTKYRDKFSDKISKVHEAYDTFKTNTANAQQRAIDDAQKQIDDDKKLQDEAQKAIDDAKALADAQALALAKAEALQKLNDDISGKEAEITTAQTELDQLNQDLIPITTTQQQFNTAIATADQKIQEFTDRHAELTQLHNKLEGYYSKGLILEDDDIPVLETLEKALYGENKPTLGLRSSDNRKEQLQKLEDSKKAQEELKTNIETDLATCLTSIQVKTDARDLKQTELTNLNSQLEALRSQLPPVVVADADIPIVVADIPVVDVAVQPIAPKQLGIKALLAGKNDIDINKINETQNIKNNPLISKKALFAKIANRADDDFYDKTVAPGLKFLTSVLAANPQAADKMYNTWKAGLEECADLWKAAGSLDQDIDSLTNFDTLFENIMKANDALDFLAKSNLNVTQFFQNLSTLKIPKDMKFAFAVSDAEAEKILDDYLKNPSNQNQLQPLFARNTEFYNWPTDCQFFLAVTMLSARLDNANLATDAQARKDRLDIITEAEKIQEPGWVGIAIAGLKTAKFFNSSLSGVSGWMPRIEPEAIRLGVLKQELIELSPTKKLSDEQEAKFKDAFVFAKTPQRMAFDQAYIKFATELRTEAINAIVAKHDVGTELNLFKIGIGALDLRSPGNEAMKAQKDYITTLNTAASKASKTKKQEALEKTQATFLIGSLNFIQSLGTLAVNNPTMVDVTKVLDGKVMATMRDQGPLNLETTEFIPWLQDTVLKPISAVV